MPLRSYTYVCVKMPASTSSPSPLSDVSGLKTYANYDAVLPSSPEVERLTPVPNSQQSTTNSPGDTSEASHHTPASNITLLASNGMSPREPEYMGVDGFEPFDENDFLNSDFNYFQEAVPPGGDPNAPTPNVVNQFSRRSTGLATHSSHLMSPELSDAPSPETPHDDVRALKPKLFDSAMSRESTHGSVGGTQPPNMVQTPATTAGSSSHMSPGPSSVADRVMAPRVQVDSYSRGDSPARVQGPQNELRRKRSRGSQSSPHLAPDQRSSEDEDAEGEPLDDGHGRVGLDPSVRKRLAEDPITSLAEQEDQKHLEEQKESVSRWLSVSEVGEAGSPPEDTPIHLQVIASNNVRLRARSAAGRPSDLQADALGISQHLRARNDAHIPGPGVLLQEESGEEDEDEETGNYAESAPPSVDGNAVNEEAQAEPLPPHIEEPRPEDVSPWVDPLLFPSHPNAVGQPATSNAAIMRFAKRARDIETSSRVATWGTSARRMSDGDLQRVFGSGGLFSRLSISKERTRDTEQDQTGNKDDWKNNLKESVEQAALRFRLKRMPSTSRRKQSEPARPTTQDSVSHEATRKESLDKRTGSPPHGRDRKGSRATPLHRIPSVSKQGPMLNMTAAVASATNIATLGHGASVNSSAATSPTVRRGPFKLTKGRLSRHTSQDSAAPNITGMLAQQGGPPVPNLSSTALDEMASPVSHEQDAIEPPLAEAPESPASDQRAPDEAEKAVAMNLEPRKDMIIPTFEGFKANIRNVNPRLVPWLVERLGQEQLRRYKKLVEFKVKHAQHMLHNSCESGEHCAERGGAVTYFPAKGAPKEPKIAAAEDEEDEEAVADGVITDGTFPPGVPKPPVKRLPAQFECPLCFQVKKLQKPSDWSKHVHEDLQPFTCTFPQCPDPKSFKRKADWVRHENERHRQLEWWQCTEEGCAHLCYRRDNFVQHLVREHKMPEPKGKGATLPANGAAGGKKAVRGPAKAKARGGPLPRDPAPEDRVLLMVETCRRETPKSSMAEPCRFCGNVCNSFKKLTVHLARHMEQISTPVLDLVANKDVTPETIISPIENRLPPAPISPADAHGPYAPRESISLGPYDQPVSLDPHLPDIPGFAPVPGAGTFHDAQSYTNPNFPAWSSASMPPQTTTMYGGALHQQPPPPQQSWVPPTSMYDGSTQAAAAYGMVSPMQARMISPGHASNADAYGGGASPALAAGYADPGLSPASGYGMQAAGTQGHSPHAMHSPHVAESLPLDYDLKDQMAYSQAPGPAMGYQSAGQPPPQQSQQQYYGQY